MTLEMEGNGKSDKEGKSENCCSKSLSVMENTLQNLSAAIIGTLERGFFFYGKAIARYPYPFIAFCLVLTGVCSIGIVNFSTEGRPFKLWIPENSEFLQVMDWKEEHFPSDVRVNMVLYESENVLDKEAIKEMMKVHDAVASIKTGSTSWEDVCSKVPVIATSFYGRKKRDSVAAGDVNVRRLIRERRQATDEAEDNEFDFSLLLPRNRYCNFLESMEQECLENSLLEVFGYDWEYIESLSQEDILSDVNLQETSAVFGFPTNFSKYMSKIERDANGDIVKAGASVHRWFTKINRTSIDKGSYKTDAGSSSKIDIDSFQWEQKLIENILNFSRHSEILSVYLMASTSFGTVSGENIQNDTKYLSVGFGIVFIYIILMLGNFNMVEMRPILSLLGLSCVGLAVGVSYGVCSAFNVPYGPVNSILPFLLLGLGVDDMFVVMQSLENLSPEEKQMDLETRIGITLKHAGVSITVTSVTDFVAFAVGSSTVLPALRSFCLYAAIGIASIYFFQATFFVAWLSLDQRRLEDQRHGFLWCWKLKNWRPNPCSRMYFCQSAFGKPYAMIFLNLPMKIFVIILTFCILAVSGWGLSNLRQEFNSIWFLPKDSYLYEYFMKLEEYFPSDGALGTIYFGNTDILSDLPKIEELIKKLNDNEYISEVDGWYTKYKRYWEKQGYVVPNPNSTEEEFLDQLSQFLHSSSGAPFRARNFRFSERLNCTEQAPPVKASSIDFKHIRMSSSREKVKAMDAVREIIKDMNFSGYVGPWSMAYGEWETNKVIVEELYRNMGLALIVVFCVTLILIASLSTSLLVLLCVLLTLVDVGALMHWWGLTIDTVSCIDLVLAIGLCVDYAAHVGHTFMTKTGTRNERAAKTIETIGPAVLSGGFSTFLSFVFLANSGSHVFLTFFKIFFAVCFYGLYHGLIFLPVILSLIGPSPYKTAIPMTKTVSKVPLVEEKEKKSELAIRNGGFIEKEITSSADSSRSKTQHSEGSHSDLVFDDNVTIDPDAQTRRVKSAPLTDISN